MTRRARGLLGKYAGYVPYHVGLATLALLVTESDPKDKDVLIRLVMNMLVGKDK
jgi:hypothetical protein